MENGIISYSRPETLNDSICGFPRHRRRPFKSHTYTTFSRLLRLSRDPAFASQPQEDVSMAADIGSEQDREFSDMEVRVGGFDTTNIPREGNDDLVRDNTKINNTVNEIVSDKNAENGFSGPASVDIGREQDIEFGDVQVFDFRNIPIEGKDANLNNLVGDKKVNDQVEGRNIENGFSDPALNIIGSGHDMKAQQFDSRDVLARDNTNLKDLVCESEEFSVKEIKGVEESHILEVCDSVIIDMEAETEIQIKGDIELNKLSKETEQKLKSIEMALNMDMEDELEIQMKNDLEISQEMVQELQSIVDIDKGNDEINKENKISTSFNIEEGEISGEEGLLFEDKKAEEVKVCEDTINDKKFAREVVNYTQIYETGASEKKRKRGPMTQEKKAKRKKKERIKRAEKRGVKRLKIQPVSLKPKKVNICRHYNNGRCHEGEKCKFSHDTTPLTKSKPCCHFARNNSCMKGDDCPYDHVLSKYPCNNFITTGSCNRGANCMFSHKITANQVSSTAMESGLKSPLTEPQKLKEINHTPIVKIREQKIEVPVQPPKGVNIYYHHKSLSPTENGKAKIVTEPENGKKVKEVIEKSTIKVPKGINFLSFGQGIKDSGTKTVSNLVSDSGIVKSVLDDSNKSKEIVLAKEYSPFLTSANPYKTVSSLLGDKSASENSCSSSKTCYSLNTSTSVQKALQSTLSFAAKFDSEVKFDPLFSSCSSSGIKLNEKVKSSENKLTVLDFLCSNNDCKTKT